MGRKSTACDRNFQILSVARKTNSFTVTSIKRVNCFYLEPKGFALLDKSLFVYIQARCSTDLK